MTAEEFRDACLRAFRPMERYGFTPKKERGVDFRFSCSNGRLTLVVEGNYHGLSASAHFEDDKGTEAPLMLFVPTAARRLPARKVYDQASAITVAADDVMSHCGDLLSGDVARFYERAAEWRRVTRSPGGRT